MPDGSLAARRVVPAPVNEPVRAYERASPERARLAATLTATANERIDIPLVIGGRRVRGTATRPVVMPCAHRHGRAACHMAGPSRVAADVEASLEAGREWAAWPWADRLAVFLKAAELLATTWRDRVNTATMLGQGKTVYQAEIESACDRIDF